MVTVLLVLVVIAMVLTVAASPVYGKPSLWAAVFVLCLIELLRVLPLGQ